MPQHDHDQAADHRSPRNGHGDAGSHDDAHGHEHGPGCSHDHGAHDHGHDDGHDGEHDGGHGHDHGGHGHNHNHGHNHAHGLGGHSHAPANFGRAFAIGITLNLLYVAGEAIYGVIGGSLALLSDAGHNLGDVLGIGAAWLASVLGRRRPAGRFTYGLRRSSILSALFNATLLLVITGGIAWEAIWRLLHPVPVGGTLVMIVAAIGIVVNGVTALLFMSGAKDDLNLRGAFLHMLSDALTAAAVVVAGLLIALTGWERIDPAVSLVVSAVIVIGTWSLLRQSVALALDAVPQGIDQDAVAHYLRALPGVSDLHHLHIWGMSTTETALTVHLVRAGMPPDDALLRTASAELRKRFGIGHATFQVEQGADCVDCATV
ncbi:cation diffusion facilitator family transporter [Acetobacteraceae bacterium KSS8]|uniref:Cation diffusion facilitator family transporter n=1 Tax=Endosaccharibacter trunci TaxID=2812733 RepID=A0ABT1W5N5_9PROT|nr:cation diffusion facilitator family transporter [Acetobacteraceae bacterium KSS8]